MPHMHDHPRKLILEPRRLVEGLLVMVLLISACGDDPLTPAQASDRAAGAACDYQARCQHIGAPPATFTSRDDCLITSKASIQNDWWPPARCAAIVQTGFDVCVAAIKNLACDNPAGLFSLVVNCSAANVCGTP